MPRYLSSRNMAVLGSSFDGDFTGLTPWIPDDLELSFGGASGTADAWFKWNTSTTPDQFQLSLTDIDGGGTNGIIWRVQEGTNDVDFLGAVEATGNLSSLGDLSVPSGNSIYLDGGGDTRLKESVANQMGIFAGGSEIARISATGIKLMQSGDYFLWHNNTNIRNDANGTITIGNNGISQGIRLDTATLADFVELEDESGNGAGVVLNEMSDPGVSAANTVRIYARDTGGKTELVAVFPSGAVQQIAIEP